ncbi:MAG: hypothetical protein K0S07_1427 [Chlamydiales bacterium]|jgi:hypothetical protein|nr:hypothetical protein [Chlamydiales bacterium]
MNPRIDNPEYDVRIGGLFEAACQEHREEEWENIAKLQEKAEFYEKCSKISRFSIAVFAIIGAISLCLSSAWPPMLLVSAATLVLTVISYAASEAFSRAHNRQNNEIRCRRNGTEMAYSQLHLFAAANDLKQSAKNLAETLRKQREAL